MQFHLNSDHTIEADQRMETVLEEIVRDELSQFSDRITRVELHVSDENSRVKGGPQDKRCTIEVRLAGLDPRSATHKAPSLKEAVVGASGKAKRQIESTLGKLNNKHHEKLTTLDKG